MQLRAESESSIAAARQRYTGTAQWARPAAVFSICGQLGARVWPAATVLALTTCLGGGNTYSESDWLEQRDNALPDVVTKSGFATTIGGGRGRTSAHRRSRASSCSMLCCRSDSALQVGAASASVPCASMKSASSGFWVPYWTKLSRIIFLCYWTDGMNSWCWTQTRVQQSSWQV